MAKAASSVNRQLYWAAAFIVLLIISAYVFIQFATFTPTESIGIPLFGVKVPTLFSASLQAVDTELNVYSTLTGDILILSGALLGFYSLVVIEVIKATIRTLKEQKGKLLKGAVFLTTLFLVASIYSALFFSVINASTAATAQGNVDSYACMKAITLAQINLSMSNKTSGEVSCLGVVTQIAVSPSAQTTAALGAQLSGAVQAESQSEHALFIDTLNSTIWLESVFFILPFLLLVYALNFYLAYRVTRQG